MYREEEVFLKAMDLGIKGYLLKEDAVSDILRCLETVQQGRFYISASISDYMARRIGRKAEMDQVHDLIESLTAMERKVLKKVGEMKTSRAIADELFISTKTVNNHRNNISAKLNLQGSHALLKFAIEHKANL
jgi:DNA-binding NarL/FixJ family response regulator